MEWGKLKLIIMVLTISTINVRGVRTKVRAQSTLSFLSNMETDVILLQECGIPFLDNYTKWQEMWPYPSLWSGSNENKNDGVAILIKNPLITVKESIVVREGRALSVTVTFMGRIFKILNIYGFNNKHERYDLLEGIKQHLLGGVSLIVGGDFNCVLSRKDRKRGRQEVKVDQTSILLQLIVRDFKLVDCYKSIHPKKEGFTWESDDGSKASRIDYIFARDLTPVDAKVIPTFFSTM